MATAFDRSALGRQNRALFYNVDRVVYVEGGRADKGVTESFDGLFWKRLLSTLRPDLKTRILPRGGKENLVALASTISQDGTKNVLVAMDRDYDELLGRAIKNEYVLYTYGYSFENDVFHKDTLVSLFYSLCPVCDDAVGIENTVAELIDEFSTDVWWPQLGDICGGVAARKVIDREHTPKYMMSSAYGSRPKLSKSALAIDVFKANSGSPRTPVRGVGLKRDMMPELAVGHLYATFCYRILSYLHSLYSNTSKLTKDAVTAGAITNLCVFIASNSQSVLGLYYAKMLAQC